MRIVYYLHKYKIKKVYMKTKRKYKSKKTRKGGHKVVYNYKQEIGAKTNTPLPEIDTATPREDCLACVLKSLGMMSEETALKLQKFRKSGVHTDVLLDMVNKTYGEGHTFNKFFNEKEIKEYLKAGEATVAHIIIPHSSSGGHFFIVYRSDINNNLYNIDPQNHTVTLLSDYLSTKEKWQNFGMLKEPNKIITNDTLINALKAEDDAYYQSLENDAVHQTVEQQPVKPSRNHMFDSESSRDSSSVTRPDY